jgi:hypothetical protein
MAIKCSSLVADANTAPAATNYCHADLGSPAQTVASLNLNFSTPETHHPIKECAQIVVQLELVSRIARPIGSVAEPKPRRLHCDAAPVLERNVL